MTTATSLRRLPSRSLAITPGTLGRTARAAFPAALAAAGLVLCAAAPARADELPSINTRETSPEAAARLRQQYAEDSWYVVVGDVTYSPGAESSGTARTGAAPSISEFYYGVGRELPTELQPARVGGSHGFHILHLPGGIPEFSVTGHGHSHKKGTSREMVDTLYPLEPGQVLMERVQPRTGTQRRISDPHVQTLVNQVDEDRYYTALNDLAAFGRRNTFSSEVILARDFIAAEFSGLGLTVTTPSFSVSGTTAWNVVGELTGSSLPGEIVLVGAHYDSVPNNPSNSPGAEDNASGVASVLEIAKILAPFGSQRTIRFIAYGGEEQGLFGSDDYVSNMSTAERNNLVGSIVMDMVAYTSDATLDVLLETDPSSGSTLRTAMADAAADFTTLSVFTSNNPFGSDHMPFINAGLPSVLAIENEWAGYGPYHTSNDTVAQITREQGAEITKMNLAALARLANPNPVPVMLQSFDVE